LLSASTLSIYPRFRRCGSSAGISVGRPRLSPPDKPAEDTFWQEEYDKHHENSEYKGPVDRVGTHKSAQGHDDGCSQHGSQKDQPAAEEAHDDGFHGKGPEKHVGKDARVNGHEEAACYPGKEGGDHQSHELVPPDVYPYHFTPYGIVPNPLQDGAEGRPDDPVHHVEADGRYDKRKIVGAL